MAGHFDAYRYLESRKLLIEATLNESLTSTNPNVDRIIESMRYSLLAGGKRLRPILCLATCELFGGDISSALPTAVALEMIHTMSLIHDDLPAMENSDWRRGKPAIHKVFGEDIAILAGDALLAKSFEYVVKETKGIPAARILKILSLLGSSSGALGLAGGQAKDLDTEHKKADLSCSEYEWIQKQKTASLLKVSVVSGATIAGASPEDIAVCEQYAERIGRAFQITEDILRATSPPPSPPPVHTSSANGIEGNNYDKEGDDSETVLMKVESGAVVGAAAADAGIHNDNDGAHSITSSAAETSASSASSSAAAIRTADATSQSLRPGIPRKCETHRAKRPTYVKIHGLQAAKLEVIRVTNEAKEILLAAYGDRAEALNCIADYIVSRKL